MIKCKILIMKTISLLLSILLLSCINNCDLSKEKIRALVKEETNFILSDFDILECEISIAFEDKITYINLKLEKSFVDSLSLLVRKSEVFDPNRVDPIDYYPFFEAPEDEDKLWYSVPFGYKFVHIFDKTRPEYVICRLDTIRAEFDYRYIFD